MIFLTLRLPEWKQNLQVPKSLDMKKPVLSYCFKEPASLPGG